MMQTGIAIIKPMKIKLILIVIYYYKIENGTKNQINEQIKAKK